jgi:tetratricopeptide (TPR) repeat protein
VNGDLVFVSHTAADAPLAAALTAALKRLAPARIDVAASTSNVDGPQGGENWRKWIDETILEANTVLVVVTPQAIGKPWLLWEAGAAQGVGLATVEQRDPPREILTVLYGVPVSACPDPLRGQQVITGTDREDVWSLLLRVMQRHRAEPHEMADAGAHKAQVLTDYLDATFRAMLTSASLVNEPNVQDWLQRLDELVDSENVRAELPGFIRWMRLAFGSDDRNAPTPIDVRLHRKLGLLLLEQRQLDAAVEELELARRSAPRDIYVLRPLGEAYLKLYLDADPGSEDREEEQRQIEVLLGIIEGIDESAFVYQPDAAALLAKYLRKAQRRTESSIEVLRRALAVNPDSSYLADLLGQAQLEIGQIDDARRSYATALEIIERKPERGIWDHATAAAANVVLARPEHAVESVGQVVALAPNPSEQASIEQGLREIARHLQLSDDELAKLLVPLRPHHDV